MVCLIFDLMGLAALKLPENISATELLEYQTLLSRIAPDLQALDEKIKRIRGGQHVN